MCGIVGYVGNQNCGEIILDGLRRLEYRGYDSAGIAIITDDGLKRLRAEGKLRGLEKLYMESPIQGTIGVGHTRWATHGKPTVRNAHPHTVDHITLVHNGIIENYVEIRDELRAKGHVFTSDTDTETVAHLVAESTAKGATLHAAVRAATQRIRGSYAFVVIDARDPDTIVAARMASPLVIGIGDGENFAASDVPAILQHTRDVIFLEDGDSVILRRDGVELFDDTGARTERPVKRITWDPVSAEKQGYRHFMLKEIHEQPAKVIDTLRGRISQNDNAVELRELDGITNEFVRGIDKVVILACGTSYHSGMVAKYAIEELARISVEVDLASEFRYRNPVVSERTLTIAISQSGETADTLAAVKEAKALGATAIAVCNVMESSIPRACAGTVYTQAGPEIGVASTKAFTTQLAVLYLIAIWLGQQRGTLTEERRKTLLTAFRAVPRLMEETLAFEATAHEMAREFSDATSFLYLGRGPQFPIALEGALKLKEISYIHAEGFAAGEMKHGPIALIDEQLPVVFIAPKDRHFEKTFSNLEEVRARGGRIIAVTSDPSAATRASIEHLIEVPVTDELFMPLLTTIPLQLLAYAIADFKGTDVDQPRNLAKSVTVE